jgi:gamma-glutamylcyclotransferase (GGCT)/AIG2-like uncharacterized protein YtfP
MSLAPETSEKIFAYGTLQLESVQLSTFGRRLEGRPDALVGYRVMMVRISDRDFVASGGGEEQRSLQFTGNDIDSTNGMVLEITPEELAKADEYEPDGYERVLVQLHSGTTAWAYLARGQV